jgi:transposase
MQKKQRPKYTEEFKQRAVELSLKGNVVQVAAELGISKSSLIRWRAEGGHSDARVSDEMSARQMKSLLAEQKRRIDELERAKKIAEMERDILKKATAFFARECQ